MYRISTSNIKNNILSIARPDLLIDWDYEKNASICSPDEVTIGSNKEVWWKCHICGAEYYKKIVYVKNGHGCKKCGYKKTGDYNSSPKKNNSKTVGDYPDVAKEWDYEKNSPLSPSEVSAGSEKKIWWICPKGHSYNAMPFNRTKQKSGCPICAGKIVLAGFNDLESQYPEVAKLWNYDKNSILPSEITPHSRKKVWWRCPKGHEWQAQPNNIVNGTKCRYCSSNLRTSLPEQAIIYYLSKVTSVKGREKLYGWEVDAFLPDYNIAIEYDGYFFHSSDDVKEREEKKNDALMSNGIVLIRIKEEFGFQESTKHIIYYDITHQYKEYTIALKELLQRINELTNNHFEIDIDFKRDRSEILKTYKTNTVQNSIVSTHPELVAEWSYDKNGDLLPEMFSSGSGERVWWTCKNGHVWKAQISSRTNGAGCPYCSGFKWKSGEGDLQTKFPEIAAEWDYDKNYPLTPDNINSGSHKKVWWICPLHHSYQSTILNRTNPTNHSGCPYCSNKRVLIGFNDLENQYPEIAAEWNYDRNDSLPSDYVFGSFKEVWWKCSKCGFEYKKRIVQRTRTNLGCPQCRQKKVICIETGQVFNSAKAAADWAGISINSLWGCLKGKTKTSGKYHWKYLT